MDIINLITWAAFTFVIFIIFATFHEFAHGWVAYRCGDPTAKQNGRLSLNPIVHIDLFWTIIMPIILLVSTGGRFAIGSAKPVPVNPSLFRNPRRDIILVGIAGPSANAIWALLLIGLMKLWGNSFSPDSPIFMPIYKLMYICMSINVMLLVFNMLPVPPLDGSRIFEALLPARYAYYYQKFSPYMFILLIALMYLGLFSSLFGFVLRLIIYIFKL
jgi:Zn-dependent protease